MAEAIAVIGFISSISQLVNYGAKVIKRLNEFDATVKGLPESFAKIRAQLPLLLNVVDHFGAQSKSGELPREAEALLSPVLDGLRKEIENFDNALLKVSPSPQASQREKISKAIKSVGIQTRLDDFRSSIQDYLNTLSAFQHTRHVDALRQLLTLVESRNPESSAEGLKLNKPIWSVKYDADEDFVGRDDVMEKIDSQIQNNKHRVALAGIGGVGKSRIAIQYCYQFRQQNQTAHVFWVHGGSRSRFETDYRKIAGRLNLPGKEDPDVDILRLVADWLSNEENGPWLMVLDNADDREIWLGASQRRRKVDSSSIPLIDYLPQCLGGRLLITTRDRQLGHRLGESRQQPLDITRLGAEEARMLLSAKLPEETLDPKDANELARELEYLPLTITQAAAYLEQTEIAASEYLTIFRAGQSDIPRLLEESIDDPGRDRESSNSVFQTWRISFEQIEKQSPKAADVLSLMAVLDRQAISPALIRGSNYDEVDHKAAIAKLKAFSLIQEEDSHAKYTLHRLVQLSTQRWLKDHGKLLYWQQAAILAVAREYPDNVTFEQWALIQDLSSHVQIVLAYDTTERQTLLEKARILHSLGHYTMEQSCVTPALQILQEAHALRTEHLGKEHELTLESMGLVGLAHSRLNQVKQSRQILSEFHEAAERTLGPRHRLTLKGMSRLAVTYNKLGNMKDGKDLLLQVLSLTEATFGATSEDAIRLLTNLAYCYNRLHQWRDAEDVGLRAYRLRIEQQGQGHPDTLTIMGSLAWTYRAQSRFQEAEELESRALKRRLEVLGADHPKTQRTMANMAELLGLLGRWDEAENLQQQVVEGKRRADGAHHWSTRRAERYLAMLEQRERNPQYDHDVKKYLTRGNGDGPRERNMRSNHGSRKSTKKAERRPEKSGAQASHSENKKAQSLSYQGGSEGASFVILREKRERLQAVEIHMTKIKQDIVQSNPDLANDVTSAEIQFMKKDLMEQVSQDLADAQSNYRNIAKALGMTSPMNQHTEHGPLPDDMAKLKLSPEATGPERPSPSSTILRRGSTDSMATLVEPDLSQT